MRALRPEQLAKLPEGGLPGKNRPAVGRNIGAKRR